MAEAIKEIDLGPVKGPKGDKGDPGERGPEGPIGPQGKDGVVDANTAITFTQAAQRQNIASGEKFGTILGKVAKFFADLKTHAFEAPIQNLTTNVAGKALDAIMGKKLKDEIDALNSTLTNGKIYNAGDYDANILTYAETLRDNSFTIIRYRGYSSTGEPINAAPTNASGAAIIIRTSINYMAIIAIPFDNTGVYSRVKDNGTWKAWTH